MSLVKLSDYGIKSMQYYWVRRKQFNISLKELNDIGINGNVAWVDEKLIPKLQAANQEFAKHGYEIIVKDGYRSPELYELVKRKRYENDGKENTDKTLNPRTKPHSTGLAVDINLVDMKSGNEVELWNNKDWPDGVVIDYYKDKLGTKAEDYQRLQVLLRKVMLKLGFKMGTLNEFWHFEFGIDDA